MSDTRRTSTSLFRRNIDRDPPTQEEKVVVKKNLMRRFVDEGDMILGQAFLSEYERGVYDDVRGQVFGALQDPRDFFYDLVHPKGKLTDTDVDKVLFFKMVEKAVGEWIHGGLSE